MCAFVCGLRIHRAAHPCVIIEDKWRNVDLLRSDTGEELLQVVQVANLVLYPRHTEGGKEPG